ncbi:hypothetical protein G210_3276 [Candida maltosa Xu316]|uniref:Uncharacterized protein n=1 Tax=Candida maltosa (strain Xu316) TaxID=1245528 RepID=M3JUC5_CANMX|nr:hypothetical protein G210_3276 [Candida maltosa Xu316]
MFRLRNTYNLSKHISHFSYRIPIRSFGRSHVLLKDEKHKQNLRDLASALQSGTINGKAKKNDKEVDEDLKKKPNKKSRKSSKVSNEKHLAMLMEDAYRIISSMSDEQILMQVAFDGDKPFLSFRADGMIIRQLWFNEIPDTLDVLNPDDMAKVEEIYAKLEKLDADKTMHQNFFYKAHFNYNGIVIELDQYLKGMNAKFKQIRRGESLQYSPYSTIYEHISEGALYPYNVLGFDKSLAGLPLSQEPMKKVYPREFVQDLAQPGSTTIHLKKYDVNPQNSRAYDPNLDPRNIIPLKYLTQKSRKNTRDTRRDIINEQRVLHSLSTLTIVTSYNQFKLKYTNNPFKGIAKSLEEEVKTKVRLLNEKLKDALSAANITLLSPDDAMGKGDIATALRNFLHLVPATKIDGIQSYYISHGGFNIIPNYLTFTNHKKMSLRLRKKLHNHLFKTFLINLNPLLELQEKLTTMTEDEKLASRNAIIKDIRHIFDKRLNTNFNKIFTKREDSRKHVSMFKHDNLDGLDAIIFEPYADRRFKRIYWINNGDKRVKLFSRKGSAKVIRFTTVKEEYLTI